MVSPNQLRRFDTMLREDLDNMDHGALLGLGDDDHLDYLLKSGLREWDEQGSDPSTPASNKWKLYMKAAGLHLIDDAGTVTGPFVDSGGAGGGPTLAYKTANETVTSSTTLQDDNHLSFAVASGEVHAFEIFGWAGWGAGDIKLAVNGPGTPNAVRFYAEVSTEALFGGATYALGEANAYDASVDLGPITSTVGYIRCHGYVDVGANTGNVVLRWAQRISDATPTGINTGSFLRAWQLA